VTRRRARGGPEKEAVGSGAARLAGGVEPDTPFSHPDEETAHPRGKRDGGVTDACSGFQHQTGEPTDRNLSPYTVDVDQHEGAVQHV
jgi:hypothetical protein